MQAQAQDLMSREIIYVTSTTSLEEALKLLVNNRITGLPVVDEKGRVIGIFSEYDVLVQIALHKRLGPKVFQETIKFSRQTETVTENARLEEVMDFLIRSKFRRAPVVNKDKKLVGIITRRDIMRVLYYQAKLR